MEHLKIILPLLLVIAILSTAVNAYILPHIPEVWKVSGVVSIFLALLLIKFFWSTITSFIRKKNILYGLNSILMSVFFLGVIVVLNLIIIKYDVKGDFTKNKLHSLSDQSVKVVKGLTSDITFKAFISPLQKKPFEEIFDKYAYYSKHIKKEFIDVDRFPEQVEKYDVKRTGTIVVETEKRSSKVDNIYGPDDPKIEQKLTNAIVQTVKGEKKKIYFVIGHGELQLSDTGRKGYSNVKQLLSESRYQVEELAIVNKEKIPEDAESLVIISPKSNLMDHEIKLIESYLNAGGKVLVLIDPDSSLSVKKLISQYGVVWNEKKTIFENNILQRMMQGSPLMPIVVQYDSSHSITQQMRQPTLFVVSTPVSKSKDLPKDITATELFSTSSNSLEVSFSVKGDKYQLETKGARRGPISLAVAISKKIKNEEEKSENKTEDKKEKEARLVVVGDSDFAMNQFIGNLTNSDLFQNIINWLTEDEDLISIRPKELGESKFDITEMKFKVINLASVAFAPLLMFIFAIGVYISRRRK